MSSKNIYRQRISLFFLALFLFSGMTAVFGFRDPSYRVPGAKDVGSGRDYFFDRTHGEGVKQFLDRVGLNMILPLIYDFIEPFERTVRLFHELDGEKHFDILNRVIEAFKQSFIRAVEEVENARDAPSGTLSAEMMSIFMKRMDSIMEAMINRDAQISDSEWILFLGMIHHVFEGFVEAYRQMTDYGIELPWSLLSIVKTLVTPLPTNIFDRSMFGDWLRYPKVLKETLFNIIEEVMTGDQAHFIKMIATFVSSKFGEKPEL